MTQVLQTTRADGTSTLWAGTSNGIARFESGRWSVIHKQAGLLSENIGSLEMITDADGKHWIWAGTFAGGASRLALDDPSAGWEAFTTTTNPALPGDTVLGVTQDHHHRIYIGTTHGIARLTPRMPTSNDKSRFSVDLFTTEDGLPSSDCQQAARLMDERGRVWFGTARGLAMFDPDLEIPDHAPKPLVIETAKLSNGKRTLRGGESLSHRERNLSFESALLAFGGESRNRFRYQLVGFDPQPSEWIASGSKEYTNLGSGNYTFEVWGRDARGNISGPTELAFRILPAPWLTPWAFAVYILAVLAAVYGSMQWRVRVLSHRTKQLEAAVAERTRELSAARDQLEKLASVDALTDVANRRTFNTVLEKEWKRAQRGGHWLSLALLDVDYFKRFNDHYGHARGDECLRAVAQVVSAQCRRQMDLVARYGGEEFAIVLPETEPNGVRVLLRSILAAVDALQIEHVDSGCAPHVTVSLGAISMKPQLGTESHAAFQLVDQLLYKAKENGRHRAMHEDGSGSPQQITSDAEPV